MESDNEEVYPTLNKMPGNPLNHIPKKVLAVTHDGSAVYYLVSYKQDYQGEFHTPSFVPSVMLMALELDDIMLRFHEATIKLAFIEKEMALKESE